MLSLDLLRDAMQPLMEVGKGELEFDAFGTHVALRPLLPKEEVLVQRAAAIVVEQNKRFEESLREQTGGEDTAETDSVTRASALDYFDRFRVEVLSHAIVQVGSLDLRGVEFIATGETLPNGNLVKVAKPAALRPLLENWSRTMLAFVFGKYGALMDGLNKEAGGVVEETPADLDAEIDRLEERLAEAKAERARRAGGDPSITAEQIANFVGLGASMEEGAKQAAALPPARPKPPRQSVLPPTVPPPTPDPKYPLPPEPPSPSAFEEAVGPTPSSFADGDLDAVAAEEERILLARRAAPPPKDALAQAKPVGTVGGMEAYRLPTETISERGRKVTAASAVAASGVNPPPSDTRNPNFRPPKK
jgi:hypothetical protein